MVKISIIILTYNSSKYIDSLLQGLIEKFKKPINEKQIEIIVADNASLDDTIIRAEKYNNHIRVINNGGNFGFAKGNNLAVKKANGEFIAFLNPDAEFKSGDIFELLEKFNDARVGVVGGKIVDYDGKRELSCGRFYFALNSLILSVGLEEKLRLRFSPKKDRQVDFVSGAFLVIRRSLFEKLNGFDENYFMYIEDSDLCYRVKMAGFRVEFCDKATIRHMGQGSSNRTFAIVNIYKGLIYFNKKYGTPFSYQFVRIMLLAKALLLVLIGKIINNKYLVETYREASKI